MAKRVKFHINQTTEQLAYLAGIIDGEGCFFVGKYKTSQAYGSGAHFHSLIRVTSCDEILIKWLETIFGGSRDSRYRWTSKKAFCRPVFTWQASGEMLDYICPQIHKYLVIKKKHCEIMMEIRKTYANIGSKRLPQDIIEKRTIIMIELRKLNSRFHNHPLKNPSPLLP
jgi:hypothetical protein